MFTYFQRKAGANDSGGNSVHDVATGNDEISDDAPIVRYWNDIAVALTCQEVINIT